VSYGAVLKVVNAACDDVDLKRRISALVEVSPVVTPPLPHVAVLPEIVLRIGIALRGEQLFACLPLER